MMQLLSSISGKFAGAVLLGTTFPLILFSTLGIVLIAPLHSRLRGLTNVLQQAAQEEKAWSVAVVTLVIVVLSGLLYNCNILIIRLYEGYPWARSWIGQLLSWYRRNRFLEGRDLRFAIRTTRRDMRRLAADHPLIGALLPAQTRLARYMKSEFPGADMLVLPTRLGNVIRAFENYPYLMYGMDPIVLWPHLVPKIDSKFGSVMDDSKTAFDFMLNASFLSVVCACAVLLAAGSAPEFVPTERWLWRALLFFALGWVFYELATNRAAAWGSFVKTAFDLYRLELLTAFGYDKPDTRREERALWKGLSLELLYADYYEGLRIDRKAQTRVLTTPEDLVYTTDRQMTARDDGVLQVAITITNVDPAMRSAREVTITDVLPDGYTPILRSLTCDTGTVSLVKIAPLQCRVTLQLAAQKQAIVAYELKSPTAGGQGGPTADTKTGQTKTSETKPGHT